MQGVWGVGGRVTAGVKLLRIKTVHHTIKLSSQVLVNHL